MPYVDANVLAKFYLAYDESAEVQIMLASSNAQALWPFPVTTLLRLELVNSIRRFAFESRSGGQWRVTPENCSIALARLERGPCDGRNVSPRRSLARKHRRRI